MRRKPAEEELSDANVKKAPAAESAAAKDAVQTAAKTDTVKEGEVFDDKS